MLLSIGADANIDTVIKEKPNKTGKSRTTQLIVTINQSINTVH